MPNYISAARQAITGKRRGSMVAVLASGSTQLVIVFAIGHAVNFVLQVTLARWMGVSEYGTYATVINWVALLTTVSSFGLDSSALRFVPQYVTSQLHASARGFIRWAYGVSLVSSVVLAATASAFILLRSGGSPGAGSTALLIGLWTLPASTIIDYQTSLGRAYRRLVLAFAPTRIFRYLIVFVGILILLLLGARATSRNLIVISVVLLSLVAFGQWLMLRRVEPDTITSAQPVYDPRTWARVAIPLLGVTLCLELMRRVDVLMVSGMMESSSVGVYNVAKRIAGLMTFFQLAVNGMAAPMISAAHTERNKERLQTLFSVSAHITFWPTLILAGAITLLSGQLLQLFGPEFAEARTPLLILLVAQLVNASCGLVSSALAMTGRERDSLRVFAICAALNIVTVYIGIRVAGINGAAIATAGTIVTWNVWLHVLSVRHLGVYPSVIAWFIQQRKLRRKSTGEGPDSA